mgnify:FL=1
MSLKSRICSFLDLHPNSDDICILNNLFEACKAYILIHEDRRTGTHIEGHSTLEALKELERL